MKVYIYESHLGGRYATDELIDTYCEQCGDSDTLVAEGEPEDLLWDARYEVKAAIANYRELQELLKE